jgi:prepilin-type N-terminal cleavage/methylation domain-containing protein
MMKLSRMAPHDKEQGFTLVEILVSLVILLIIVIACFPLFSWATKVTHQNRVRMTAAELAKKEIETTLARITAANYVSEEADAPLKTGTTGFKDIPGRPGYKMNKTVRWVDDPEDGLHPTDKIPFDYKELIIEVSCPAIFSGSVTQKTDFKTFIAREGFGSAITGLIVIVEELAPTPSVVKEPLPGALVTINNLTTGKHESLVTDGRGLAMFPISFPEGVNTYSFAVQVEASGLIMDPAPSHSNQAQVAAYTTSAITMQLAKPATLNVSFASPAAALGAVGVTGPGYDTTIAMSAGDVLGSGQTVTKTFTDLWPFGAYTIAASYPVNHVQPADEENWEKWKDDEEDIQVFNLWQLEGPDWEAKPELYVPPASLHPDNQHRLAFRADLSQYAPGTAVNPGNIVLTLKSADPLGDKSFISMANGSEADDFIILYDNQTTDSLPNLNEEGEWKEVINLEDLEELQASSDVKEIPLPNPQAALSAGFSLRFDSSPDITSLRITPFYVFVGYLAEITLDSPGETRNISLTVE